MPFLWTPSLCRHLGEAGWGVGIRSTWLHLFIPWHFWGNCQDPPPLCRHWRNSKLKPSAKNPDISLSSSWWVCCGRSGRVEPWSSPEWTVSLSPWQPAAAGMMFSSMRQTKSSGSKARLMAPLNGSSTWCSFLTLGKWDVGMTLSLCSGWQHRKPQGSASGAHPEFLEVLKPEMWGWQPAGEEWELREEAAGRRKQCQSAAGRSHGKGVWQFGF